MDMLTGRSTLFAFGGIFVIAVILPFLAGINTMGTQRIGFPLRFFESTSAPPPAFGSTFSWKALLLDLAIYYLLAIVISLVLNYFRNPSSR